MKFGRVDRMQAIKSLTTRHPPLIDQAVLCDFMIGTFEASPVWGYSGGVGPA